MAAWLEVGPEPLQVGDLAASQEATTGQVAPPRNAPSPFDHTAQFALALFLDLAEKSVAHRLPMKLDW